MDDRAVTKQTYIQSSGKADTEGDGIVHDDPPQRNNISAKLLNHAQTLLRSSIIDRRESGARDTEAVINSLQREKTVLKQSSGLSKCAVDQKPEEEDEEELSRFLEQLNKANAKVEFTDSDFDTDLEDEIGMTQTNKNDACVVYEKSCRKLGIMALSSVSQALNENKRELALCYRSMDALDLLALTKAIKSQSHVTRLFLDGNHVGDDGVHCIALLFEKHKNIDTLSLAENCIYEEGIQVVGTIMQTYKVLTHLNLSGNKIHDYNIHYIADALLDNCYLLHLNLSHNHIGDIGASILGPALAANEALVLLDLSWNKVRPSGGVYICEALKENTNLKTLNLSMNGLSSAGASRLTEVLLNNSTLTYLDLTCNRISDEGAVKLARGLAGNEALHHLIIYDNPMTAIGVMSMLEAISGNTKTAMWKLDVHTVPIILRALDIAEESNEMYDEFELRHGAVVDSSVLILGDMNPISSKNPMTLVKEFVEHEGLRLLDFFKLMDRDCGGSISRSELVNGLEAANVRLSQAQLDRLIEFLDKDGDGEIDYAELVQGDKEYRIKKRRRTQTEHVLVNKFVKPKKLQ